MPYIRDDIAFQYFDLLFHSSLNDEFHMQDYLQVFIPYVLQKVFDFSEFDISNRENTIIMRTDGSLTTEEEAEVLKEYIDDWANYVK